MKGTRSAWTSDPGIRSGGEVRSRDFAGKRKMSMIEINIIQETILVDIYIYILYTQSHIYIYVDIMIQ